MVISSSNKTQLKIDFHTKHNKGDQQSVGSHTNETDQKHEQRFNNKGKPYKNQTSHNEKK